MKESKKSKKERLFKEIDKHIKNGEFDKINFMSLFEDDELWSDNTQDKKSFYDPKLATGYSRNVDD